MLTELPQPDFRPQALLRKERSLRRFSPAMHRTRVPLQRALAAAALLGGVLIVSGCGSKPPPRASPTPPRATETPAPRVAATGFSVQVPRGWTDHTHDQQAVDAAGASGGLQLLFIAPPTGTVSNEHIDVTTVAQPVPDDQLATYLGSVALNGATSVTTPQPFDLAGATGLFVTYNLTATATPPAQAAVLKVQDMLINHAGQTYEIVLNTAAANFDAQLQSLQSVLSSWQWSA